MADIDNTKLNNKDTETGDPNLAFQNDENAYNKPITPITKPEKNIGIDLADSVYQNLINSGTGIVLIKISKCSTFNSDES